MIGETRNPLLKGVFRLRGWIHKDHPCKFTHRGLVKIECITINLINLEKQIQKLQKRLGKMEKWIEKKEKSYAKPKYMEKTPDEVKAKHRKEFDEKLEERAKLEASIAQLQSLQ